MERDSKRHRSSDRSSGSRRKNEREEREGRERRDRRDRDRREREEREKRERERSERQRPERERSNIERKDREKRQRSERDTQRPRETERHERERSDREKQRKREQEIEEKKRREKRESDRNKRERETYGRESPKRKQQMKERHGKKQTQDWSARMDEFARRLQQHERQTIRPQTQTHSGSGASSTYIPPPSQQQDEELHSQSTYDTTGATRIDIPRFPPPMLPSMHSPMYPPMYPPMLRPYAQTGIRPYAPQYQLPKQQSGGTMPTAGQYQSPHHFSGSGFHSIEQSYTSFSMTALLKAQDWYRERNVWPSLVKALPQSSAILGKGTFNKTVTTVEEGNYLFFLNFAKYQCVVDSVDRIRWYLYINNLMYTGNQQPNVYAIQNIREYGHHILVTKGKMLVSTFIYEDPATRERKLGKTLPINSVLPFCLNGSVCYGMQIVDKTNEGMRAWWYKPGIDTTRGFYEMYGKVPYINSLHYFKHHLPFTGILIHFDALLLLKDPLYQHRKDTIKFCMTLYRGGSFIMFDKAFFIYIENERKLVTFQALFNCGAIADITQLRNNLVMLQEIPSQTCSSIWVINLDVIEGTSLPAMKRVVLRIPDRNSISCMWYWNSDFNSGLNYVQWYQSTRNWSTKFEFQSHPFTPPFAGTRKPEMEPKKLWLGTDPKNWLLEKCV